jgi:hypothetical protein
MLFKDYPSIDYIIKNKSITLIDIFKNIAFINTENNFAFVDYYIQDGESPEHVAAKFYSDTELSWLVLLVNNIADIQKEWYSDSETFLRNLNRDYGGTAYYIAAIPEIVAGDVMVKVGSTGETGAITIDSSVYTVIQSFDEKLRLIRGVCGSGGFTFNDTVLFARQDSSNGTVKPIQFLNGDSTPLLVNYTLLYYLEPYGSSIDYLYDSNNVVIDPYKKLSNYKVGINTDTIYLNTDPADLTENNFARTILFTYSSNAGDLADLPGILKREKQKTVYDDYIKKQKIKILKPEYVASVLSVIQTALSENSVGRIYRIEL